MNKIEITEAQKWLKVAKDDLLWGFDDLENQWYSRVCFIAQQAIELTLTNPTFRY